MIRIVCLLINFGFIVSSVKVDCSHEKNVCVVSEYHLPRKGSIRYYGGGWKDKLLYTNSSIYFLAPTIFTQIPNLRTLDVSRTGIHYIHPDAFIDAHLLSWLNISGNNIKNITEFIFSGARKLETIDLSFNRISNLTETCFNGLKVLRVLNLTDNRLTTLPGRIFDDTIALEILDLGVNRITSLKRNTFEKMTHLKEIDISKNRLVDLNVNIFQHARSLRLIELSDNQLTKLALSICNTMEIILMGFNRINELPKSAFNAFSVLRVLNLTENRLTILPADIFVDTVALEILDLGGNRIASLERNIFAKMDRLRKINLSGNRLVDMDPCIFQNTQILRSIDLSNNQLRNLLLNISDTIERMLAGSNQIETFFLSCFTSHEVIIPPLGCNQLTILNLSHNNLSDFRNVTNLIGLEELDLSFNYFGKINASTLAVLRNLRKLNLKHTNLTGHTYGTFSKQTQLRSLDLSENNLETLNLDMLLPYMYRTLQELYLTGNNLSEFSGRLTFQSFTALNKLDLRGNNFNCSYLFQLISLMDSKLFADFNDVNVVDDRSYIHGIECHQGRGSISDTTEKHMDTNTIEIVHHMNLQLEQLQQNLKKYFDERFDKNSQSLNHIKLHQKELEKEFRKFLDERHYNDSQALSEKK